MMNFAGELCGAHFPYLGGAIGCNPDTVRAAAAVRVLRSVALLLWVSTHDNPQHVLFSREISERLLVFQSGPDEYRTEYVPAHSSPDHLRSWEQL